MQLAAITKQYSVMYTAAERVGYRATVNPVLPLMSHYLFYCCFIEMESSEHEDRALISISILPTLCENCLLWVCPPPVSRCCVITTLWICVWDFTWRFWQPGFYRVTKLITTRISCWTHPGCWKIWKRPPQRLRYACGQRSSSTWRSCELLSGNCILEALCQYCLEA